MTYSLPELGYDYDALEPAIDTKTMLLHYLKHHQSYVDQLNKAIDPYPALHDRSIEGLLTHLNDVPEEIRTAVLNNGGGHLNHSLYWKSIGPPKGDKPIGELADAIQSRFGTLEALQKELTESAAHVFGSGWAFLVIDPDTRKLEIISLPNQDVALSHGKTPLLACDVWEHSYYLRHENRRPDYLKAFWDVVQWRAVSLQFEGILKSSLAATR